MATIRCGWGSGNDSVETLIAASFHRLKQRRLRARRGPVHVVGEDDVGEQRSLAELERPPALGRFHNNVGAEDIGRLEIGRTLNPLELEVDRRGQGPRKKGLARARQTFQEDVSADHQRRHQRIDRRIAANNLFGDFLAKGLKVAAKRIQPTIKIGKFTHGTILRTNRLTTHLPV